MADQPEVQGETIPIPEGALPKGRWQKVKDKAVKAKGLYDKLPADASVSEGMRGFSKAMFYLVGIPAMIGTMLYGSCANSAFIREYPQREYNFRPLARSEIFYKDSKPAVRYFGHGKRLDRDYTADDEDSLVAVIEHVDAKSAKCTPAASDVKMLKEMELLDSIAGTDRHLSRQEIMDVTGYGATDVTSENAPFRWNK